MKNSRLKREAHDVPVLEQLQEKVMYIIEFLRAAHIQHDNACLHPGISSATTQFAQCKTELLHVLN